MSGHLLHLGAIVQCTHAGPATPMAANSRVLVTGQPTVLQTTPWTIAGCPLPKNAPFDQTGSFTAGTTRVTSNGQPLALDSAASTCAATGQPLRVVQVQSRVVAQ